MKIAATTLSFLAASAVIVVSAGEAGFAVSRIKNLSLAYIWL
jgi:hypothetical protein